MVGEYRCTLPGRLERERFALARTKAVPCMPARGSAAAVAQEATAAAVAAEAAGRVSSTSDFLFGHTPFVDFVDTS
jgi:hypothetical protein